MNTKKRTSITVRAAHDLNELNFSILSKLALLAPPQLIGSRAELFLRCDLSCGKNGNEGFQYIYESSRGSCWSLWNTKVTGGVLIREVQQVNCNDALVNNVTAGEI